MAQAKTMNEPCIILVGPQLGQNIGMCARAMKNYGLEELRLVAPRDTWPNDEAIAASAGADDILSKAKLFENFEAAIADLTLIFATTARPRDMVKANCSPREAASMMIEHHQKGDATKKAGILFGRERSGLYNDELVKADFVVIYPTNPEFASLNLAQAVLLFGYEVFLQSQGTGKTQRPRSKDEVNPLSEQAPRGEVLALFERLDAYLIEKNYYHPPEKAETLRLNLQNTLVSMKLTSHHIRLLHGLLSTIARNEPWGEGGE